MDLIERYLVVVRRHLPTALQADIVDELAGNLRSEAEGMEECLGRPLASGEQEQMLKSHGHPWLMAGRYLPQRHLFGPALYSVGIVTIATSFVDLVRPWRTMLFSVTKVVNAVAFAGIVVFVLRARHWVTVVADPALIDRATRADYWINQTIEWTLVIVMIGTLFEALNEIWQLTRSRREFRG